MEFAPTIDLSPAFEGSNSDRLEIAKRIDSACRSTGFFIAVGHGVDPVSYTHLTLPTNREV